MRSPSSSSRARRRSPTRGLSLRRSTSRGRCARRGLCRRSSASRGGRGRRTDVRELLQASGDGEWRQAVRNVTEHDRGCASAVRIPVDGLGAGRRVGLNGAVEVY